MSELSEAREKINRIDREMARLFCERMEAAAHIANYKAEHSLPVFDGAREREIIAKNSAEISNIALKAYYTEFLENNIRLSRSYQESLYPTLSEDGIIYESEKTAIIPMRADGKEYKIILGENILPDASKYFDLNRRALIVTDSGIPEKYVAEIARQCKYTTVVTVPAGEASKSLERLGDLLSEMLSQSFDRSDCVVAVGGGVVGDLAGLAAATYMRGIDFYNVPTTLLSQLDSSIGGKTAVNLRGTKNAVGAFHQPRAVLIDTQTLKTLDERNIRAGLAEAIKMGCTSDASLFDIFERGEYKERLCEVILRSLLVKRAVVERDPRERGERKILNFGHTVGHAIESATGRLHGECVAVGMLPMCSEDVRVRLKKILGNIGLPTRADVDADTLMRFIEHDKKSSGDSITAVYVKEIGKAELISLPKERIYELIRNTEA